MKEPPIGVIIDSDFARVGGKSYAIDKINSVEVRAHRPHAHPTPVAILALAAVFCFVVGNSLIALGVIFAVVAIWLWVRGRTIEYRLLLTTSSKEVAALKSRDFDFVDGLRAKIEAAMVDRSRVRT